MDVIDFKDLVWSKVEEMNALYHAKDAEISDKLCNISLSELSDLQSERACYLFAHQQFLRFWSSI